MIPWIKLATLKVAILPNLDWQWMSPLLWSFNGRFMSDSLFGRQLTLAGDKEFNGLELWRVLYMENMGRSVEMKVAERNVFIIFLNVPKRMSCRLILDNGFSCTKSMVVIYRTHMSRSCSTILCRRMFSRMSASIETWIHSRNR